MGTVSDSPSRERALDDSYKNALIEIVRKEFPQLVSNSEQSKEELREQSFLRETVLRSEKVVTGLRSFEPGCHCRITCFG